MQRWRRKQSRSWLTTNVANKRRRRRRRRRKHPSSVQYSHPARFTLPFLLWTWGGGRIEGMDEGMDNTYSHKDWRDGRYSDAVFSVEKKQAHLDDDEAKKELFRGRRTKHTYFSELIGRVRGDSRGATEKPRDGRTNSQILPTRCTISRSWTIIFPFSTGDASSKLGQQKRRRKRFCICGWCDGFHLQYIHMCCTNQPTHGTQEQAASVLGSIERLLHLCQPRERIKQGALRLHWERWGIFERVMEGSARTISLVVFFFQPPPPKKSNPAKKNMYIRRDNQ